MLLLDPSLATLASGDVPRAGLSPPTPRPSELLTPMRSSLTELLAKFLPQPAPQCSPPSLPTVSAA